MVKDLLLGDRNKRARDDAKVISSILSERVIRLHVEIGKAKREKIWEEIKSCVGGCVGSSGARFPRV